MLVPIQFPNHFVISDSGKIEEGNSIPRPKRRSLATYSIQMPVDVSTISNAAMTQQSKAVIADCVGREDNLIRLIRQSLSQQGSDLWQVFGRKKEPSLAGGNILK